MAELDYVKKSLSDISKNNIVSQVGSVSRNSDGSITLRDNSQCTFAYNFNDDTKLECQMLKIDYSVESSNNDRSTRYNTSITMDVTIHYLKESFNENGVSQGFVDGYYQFSRLLPTLKHEIKGYVDSIEIESNIGPIKEIALTLGFYDGESDDSITFNYVDIFNSRTTQQVVSDTFGWSAVLSGVTIKPNGYALEYDGTVETTTLLIDIEEIAGVPTLLQVIVNSTKDSEKVINVSSNNEPIPRSTE